MLRNGLRLVGERFETAVPGQPVTIGRKATNDFVLKDETVVKAEAGADRGALRSRP